MFSKRTSVERKRIFKKTGFVDEKIWFYDIKNGTLDPRPIAGVFGVVNLYRDVRNTQNVDEIEKKFSDLENTVARIIHDLHDTLDKPQEQGLPATFSIVRKNLDQLRKFLFLMHYRNASLSLTYFQADHPDNEPCRSRIEKLGSKLGLDTPREMWLHFMRYYLDTPHSEIGLQSMAKNLPGADPNVDSDNFEAMTYQLQAGMYYLGVVRAAPGEEFILGHNTFGLWEGCVAGTPDLHRLYVISPQIALLLRLNYLRRDSPSFAKLYPLCFSNLIDIPIEGARSSAPLVISGPEKIQMYKASSQASGDKFEFQIVRLSKQQTYAINSVVLLNTKVDGSLTFLSGECMRSTVRRFWEDRNPFAREKRVKYKALIRQLSSSSAAITGEITPPACKPIAMPAPPQSAKFEIAKTTTPPFPPSTSSKGSKAAASKKPATQSQAIIPSGSASDISGSSYLPIPGPSQGSIHSTSLNDLDGYILAQVVRLRGAPTPPKKHYEQMHRLWKLCCIDSDEIKSHPFVCEYQRMLREMIQRSTTLLENPPPSLRAHPQAELVNTMDSGDVEAMMIIMDKFVNMMGFNFDNADPVPLENIDHKNTEVKVAWMAWRIFLEDVVILGFLSWLAKNRHDVLDKMFGGKLCIYRTPVNGWIPDLNKNTSEKNPFLKRNFFFLLFFFLFFSFFVCLVER